MTIIQSVSYRYRSLSRLSAVSGYGTNQRDCIRENFWFIVVTEGNEDETEITDTTNGCRQGDQGHSPDYPQAVLSTRKDPHRAGWIAW